MNTSNIFKNWSRDLFYVITCKLNILVGLSGQIPVGAIRTIVKILALRVIVCHLGGSGILRTGSDVIWYKTLRGGLSGEQ